MSSSPVVHQWDVRVCENGVVIVKDHETPGQLAFNGPSLLDNLCAAHSHIVAVELEREIIP